MQALLDKHLSSLSDNEKFKARSLFEMSEQVSLETMQHPPNSSICALLFRSKILFS